jgi:hypothetical protein
MIWNKKNKKNYFLKKLFLKCKSNHEWKFMTITDRCFQLGFLSKLGPIIVVISSYAWDFMVGFVQLRGIQTIQVDFFGFCPFTFEPRGVI